MTQKIIVQDGNVVYSTSDPAYDVNFGINGHLNVSKEVIVGQNGLAGGIISTNIAEDLTITTGAGGNLKLSPLGSILLNNVAWPSGPLSVTQGSYLGASNLNTLAFYPFVIAFNGSDALDQTALNLTYPLAQPGQSVIGPTVVYQCVSFNTWRILGANAPGAFSPNYEEYVATAAQTVFNTTMPTTAKVGGRAYLQVYIDGIFQQEGVTKQFTVTGPNQITFSYGITLNSDVVIFGYT